MKNDLANAVSGGGILKIGAAGLYFENGLNLDPESSTFNLNVDGYGKFDERTEDMPLIFTGTPMAGWGLRDVLFPYLNWPLGSYITPVIRFRDTDINPSTESITLTGKFLFGLATGEKVYFGTHGTLPTGISRDTIYYVKVGADQVITLHDTAAHAVAGTNTIAFTDDGEGQHSFVVERSLVFHSFAGKRITFYNGAITKPGDLTLSATKTMYGEFTFRSFLRNRKAHSDANSRYLIEDVPFDDTSFNPDDILTQAYTVKWGDAAPWNEMYSQDGIKLTFDHTMEDRKVDGLGITSMRLAAMAVNVGMIPVGIDEEDVFAKLKLQGDGATIGASLKARGMDMDITGTGVFIRIYGAALKKPPLRFNDKDDRAGEMEWIATRSFPGGVAQPLALIADVDPDAE